MQAVAVLVMSQCRRVSVARVPVVTCLSLVACRLMRRPVALSPWLAVCRRATVLVAV